MNIKLKEIYEIRWDPQFDILLVVLRSGVKIIYPRRSLVPAFFLGYCRKYEPDFTDINGNVHWLVKWGGADNE